MYLLLLEISYPVMVTKTSYPGIPLSKIVLPTSSSLPYSEAVSICLQPIFKAYLTAHRVVSPLVFDKAKA